MELTGHVALVTGASRGIGRAIALELGGQGATVIGTATSEKGAEGISAALTEAGIGGAGRALDVTDGAAVDEMVKAIARDFGPVTILVNNAGIARDNLLLRMKDAEWDEVLATNLSAIFRVSRTCLRGMMKARSGRIINIASVVGATGNPGQANYAAAKAGIGGFTRSLAHEVGTRGITVNTVAPGFVDTDMTRDLPEEQKEKLLDSIAVKRLAQPEEIAHACAFLSSPRAGYITGQTLHVNGGMYMV